MVCRIVFSSFVAMVSILLIIPAPYARVYGFSPGRASFSLSAWVSRGAAPGPRWGRRPWTPLGAPPPTPWPAFEKSGGKLAGKLFWFLTDYAGGPLIGSGPLGWRPGFGMEKTGVSFEGTVKTAALRGGGGWAPPTRPQPGCARLRACFGGAVGPAKTPPPPPGCGPSVRAARGRRRLAAPGGLRPPRGQPNQNPQAGAWGFLGRAAPRRRPPGEAGGPQEERKVRAGRHGAQSPQPGGCNHWLRKKQLWYLVCSRTL